MSLVAYGDSSGSEEENELVSESGKDKDIRKLLSVLPAPVKGKKNQPVRIGLPSLSHHGVQRGVSHLYYLVNSFVLSSEY